MTRPDLLPILKALVMARDAAEKAYQASPLASRDRVVLGGLVDDLDTSIAQVRDLSGGAA